MSSTAEEYREFLSHHDLNESTSLCEDLINIVADLEVENLALKNELKKCVPMHFRGEINPVVNPDLDPDAY